MRLQLQGVIETGVDLLDGRIRDIAVHIAEEGVQVYTTTGRNGGLVGYRIDDSGGVTVQTTVIFPPNVAGVVSERLVLGAHGNGPVLFVGTTADGLIGYGINEGNGLVRNRQLTWEDALHSAANGGRGIVEAWVTHGDTMLNLFPQDYAQDQIVSLLQVTVGGHEYVPTADAGLDAVTVFRRDGATGRLTETDQMGMRQGLGISAPTALEVVEIGGQTYVVLAASGTSSLSVMRLEANGALTPTDHLIDTGHTRFANVQAMTAVTSGDHAFVIAGGADHGLSVFLMLPGGKMLLLETIADGPDSALYNVSALRAVVSGDMLHLFAGSQRDNGMTHFTLSLEDPGIMRTGNARNAEVVRGTGDNDILLAGSNGDTLEGGAGDDVLVAGPGNTWMRGGAGADIFVMHAEAGTVRALDFERGIDRLDLTDLPMLRSLEQLTIIATATGARIEYRGSVIVITAANRTPLTADDLFPGGDLGPDRVPFVRADNTVPLIIENAPPTPPPSPAPPLAPRPPPSEPRPDPWEGRVIWGTGRNDTLEGGNGDDTIWGLAGDDLIRGIRGNNL
ncbi:MAG TPA: hypothetical protein GX700_05450, partial [Paracoccus sp.]|nr:hypothetical protein [Paracoccus sp. (in: a-proteobacteria)]